MHIILPVTLECTVTINIGGCDTNLLGCLGEPLKDQAAIHDLTRLSTISQVIIRPQRFEC